MANPTTFDTAYGQEPWSGVDRKTIPYYVPSLLETFRMRNVYAGFTTFAVDLRQQAAEQMTFTEVYDLEPSKAVTGNRDLWFNTMYFDSRAITINCERHDGKVALHKYDPMVTYWRRNGGNLTQIAQGALGQALVDQMDELTRDAYLNGPFWLIAGHTSNTKSASGYPNFSIITASDTFDPDVAAKVWLIMDEKNVPMANDPSGLGGRMIFSVTTPGVWYDLITGSNSFKDNLKTLQLPMLMNYEVGQHLNTRYIKTARNVLWNCGTIVAQTTLTADVPVGGGAALTVDQVYTVGQASLRTSETNSDTGQRYITVADATDLNVGDMITLHKTRTGKYGVSNGVDFREATLSNRRIVAKNGTQLSLDKPVLKCEYVQGDYVTKALNIHANIFIGGPRAVVWAMTQSPSLYQPPVIDDGMGQKRFTFDYYGKPQPFRPEFAYVVYSAGSSSEGMLPN